MVKVRVATIETAEVELPDFTQSYELIVTILRHIKANRFQKSVVCLTRLANIDKAMQLRTVAVFVRFVQFHTKSGKIAKKSYPTLLARGYRALADLYPKVREEDHIVERLACVKEELEELVPRTYKKAVPKRLQTEIEEITSTEPKKKITQRGNDITYLQGIAKSDRQQLDYGESGIIKRSAVFLKTGIPELVLRELTVVYGFNRLSGIYLMASHARVLGVPVCDDEGNVQSPEDLRRQAEVVLRQNNRVLAKHGRDTYALSPMDPVNTFDHMYWMLFPEAWLAKCGLAKFGTWAFSEPPKPVQIHAHVVD